MHDFGMDEESEWGTDDDDADMEARPMQITAGRMGKVEVWLTDINPFNTRTEQDDQDIDELLRDEQPLPDVEIKPEIDTIGWLLGFIFWKRKGGYGWTIFIISTFIVEFEGFVSFTV